MSVRLLALLWLVAVPGCAQLTRSLMPDVHTVRVVAGDDVLAMPVVRVGKPVEISFDHFTHAYTRFVYHVELCNADWTPATQVFESEWLEGFNDQPIDDYENSFNTSVLYTHYNLRLPNDDVRLLLPGNYRVSIYAEAYSSEAMPVAEACFMLLRPEMSVAATVSTNTDIDFQQHHQQVTFSVGYGNCRVVDPQRELYTVVMQNRRADNAVSHLPPSKQNAAGAVWDHRRELIFTAGAEFHKCEVLDMHVAGLGVDRMAWADPYYEAWLFGVQPARSYTYDQDVNGAYVVRHSSDEDNDTQTEYVMTHFALESPLLAGGDVYVCGLWDNGFPDPRCRMSYDEAAGVYRCAVLLKQGYYNYQFRQLSPEGRGVTARTEGDHYQTENEYTILVYYRPQGARYDALVGYSQVSTMTH